MLRDVTILPEVPAAPFASLSEAKAYLGIAGSGSDTLLTSLLTTATATVEAYCNTVIGLRAVEERITLDCAMRSLVLRHAPAVEVTSLEFDGTAQTVADYRLSKSTGMLREINGVEFGPDADWVVEYSAGWSVIPEPIKRATLELVKAGYLASERDGSIAKESVPDVADTEYRAAADNLITGPNGTQVPHNVAAFLEPYTLRHST